MGCPKSTANWLRSLVTWAAIFFSNDQIVQSVNNPLYDSKHAESTDNNFPGSFLVVLCIVPKEPLTLGRILDTGMLHPVPATGAVQRSKIRIVGHIR